MPQGQRSAVAQLKVEVSIISGTQLPDGSDGQDQYVTGWAAM